jgi:hypothetical protein
MPVSQRRLYQSAAVFVGPTPCTGQHFSSGNSGINLVKQLPQIQSFAVNANVPRTDVNVLGKLAREDQIIIEPPRISTDISWLLVDGKAEATLGFAASGGATIISGLLDGTQDDKNYFILLTPEGTDAINNQNSGINTILALGNGYVSNYSVNIAVGQLPRASLTIESLGIQTFTGTWNQPIPAVNINNGQNVTGWNFSLPIAASMTGANQQMALRPGDVSLIASTGLGFGTDLSGTYQAHVQSVNIAIPLTREVLNQLGSPFGYARKITPPINSTMTVEALVTDLQSSNLASIFCNDVFFNLGVQLRIPNCQGTGSNAITFSFLKAKLSDQTYDLSIGPNMTTRLSFTNQLAGVGGDISQGVQMSGSYNS